MSRPSESQAKILLVEPDPVLAAAARRVLERRDFEVIVAGDADQALARLEAPFDVAIVSITLPKGDGLALSRNIMTRAPATQIILLTDSSSVSAAMMGLQEGAFAYILKPIADYLQLTHSVERAIELTRLRRAGVAAPSPTSAYHQPDIDTLNELSDITRQVRPQSKMLEGVLKSAAQIFDARKAIALLGDDSQNLHMVAGTGSPGQTAAARDFIHVVGEEFAWRVAKERKTLTATSPNKKSIHVGVPLISRGRLVGVLVVYEIAADQNDPERVAWLEAYAAQAAAGVELTRLDEENARLAQNDPVTGAYKESAFLELAEREFRRSWRFNVPLSVVHVQVEGLVLAKPRQEVSDRVMRTVADICRQSVRNIDLVARDDDDSFTLLLLMTQAAGANIVAERILRAIRALPNDRSLDGFTIALQLGVTTYPHEGCASLLDLIEIARSTHSKQVGPAQNVIVNA